MKEQTIYIVYQQWGIRGEASPVMVYAKREDADDCAKLDPRRYVVPWDMVL